MMTELAHMTYMVENIFTTRYNTRTNKLGQSFMPKMPDGCELG
jgi:hypothetical protein